jgi:hypothetical protein
MEKTRFSLLNWLDKLFKLNLKESEQQVEDVKQDAIKQVEEVKVSLHKAGKLQKQVMKKTTTYYLGKAAGVIK